MTLEILEKQAQERRQKYLRSVKQVEGWDIKVKLSATEVFTLLKVLCRSLTLDEILQKQMYRIFSCNEEKKAVEDLLHRLLQTHRKSSCHLDRMTHPDYRDRKWHGDIDDILYIGVHGELLKIDLNLQKYKINKLGAKEVINELKNKKGR